MDIEEKIDAAKKLINQREEIDLRLAELFGGEMSERKRTACSSCGQTGHNARSCPSSGKANGAAIGEALLATKEIVPSESWVRTSRIVGNSHAPSRIFRLAHDSLASHIALDVEIGARSAERQFRHHIEIINHAPERTRRLAKPLRVPVPPTPGAPKWIEPDALFGIDDNYFAIEADTGSESIEGVIKPKIRAYREIVASCVIDDHFGIDNLRVLFVTTSEKRMRNMIAAVASIAKNGRSTMFGFACRPDLGQLAGAAAPDGRLFSQPWRRAGNDDLRIDFANK